MATVSLRDEATELLQALIRLDTVNPPGNETLAAELLRDYLAGSGVEAELIAKVPERANLVARLPGRGDGPTLLLLSHTDTVLADPGEWQRDPWSGDLRRRRDLGARRARHEGPGRGGGGRDRLARARGLRAARAT